MTALGTGYTDAISKTDRNKRRRRIGLQDRDTALPCEASWMTSEHERDRRTSALAAALRAACDPRRSKYLATYFGNPRSRFAGLTAVAAQRVARAHADAFETAEVFELLASPVAEHRYVGLVMLARKYDRGDRAARQTIAAGYLRALRHVDHWVLVDVSAPYILGRHLLAAPRTILRGLAVSSRAMDRRIAIVATWPLIKNDDYQPTLQVARLLVKDEEPLIQRAVGWMLRELGKRSPATAERFLARHGREMPRLMWRYAIERLPEATRRRLAVAAAAPLRRSAPAARRAGPRRRRARPRS
jgi:3-methyladenine DNA glycosylase AlkD